jgi:hypothetical protein
MINVDFRFYQNRMLYSLSKSSCQNNENEPVSVKYYSNKPIVKTSRIDWNNNQSTEYDQCGVGHVPTRTSTDMRKQLRVIAPFSSIIKPLGGGMPGVKGERGEWD